MTKLRIKNFYWQNIAWQTCEANGDIINPQKNNCYYSADCVNIVDNDILELSVKYSPKTINYWNGRTYYPKFSTGLISSRQPVIGSGEISFEFKLPKGKNLFPAVWLWGHDNLCGYREIDILEAKSNCLGGYYKFPFNWYVTTNLSSKKEEYDMLKAVPVKISHLHKPTKEWNTCRMVYKQNECLRFYYNSILVREIYDKKLLNQFKDKSLSIVINNHPTAEFGEKDINNSVFQIRNFKSTFRHIKGNNNTNNKKNINNKSKNYGSKTKNNNQCKGVSK